APRPLPAAASSWPTISVVIPTLNQAGFVGRTVESVLNQGYPYLETFAIDRGSGDGTSDELRRYEARLTGLVTERGAGPARAVNKGLTLTRGEVIGWLNAGDMLTLDALREVGQAFAADPDLDLVFGNAVYVDEQDRPYLEDHEHH